MRLDKLRNLVNWLEPDVPQIRSTGRTRTSIGFYSIHLINSPSLYQLSYGTIIKFVVSSEPHTSEVVCGQNKRATPTKQAKPPWLPHEKSTRHTYKTWHTCNNIFKHYSAITNHLLWSDRFNVLSVLGFSPKR